MADPGRADATADGAATPAASRPAATPPGWLRTALLIAAKDLRVEWRSREILTTMTFLGVLVFLIFAFAFDAGNDAGLRPGVTAGVLWVAVLFSGVVGLSRIVDRERDGEPIRTLLLSPAPRSAIYAGKVAAVTALMAIVEAVLTPLAAFFFSASVAAHAAHVALLLLLGTVGFAAVGVVFSAALLRARSRDVLLSTLLFPVVVPVLMAGARATGQLLDPATADLGGPAFWTRFLVAVDVIFLTVGVLAFDPVVSGD